MPGLGMDVGGDSRLITARSPRSFRRLGKAGRLFGWKEVRHLRHRIRADEVVLALAQGVHEKKQGLLVLTSTRLFFFEKGLASERIEEFPLAAISSIEVGKRMTGERLVVHASGNQAEIKQVIHGQAEELARLFRDAKQQAATPAALPPSTPDALDQIRRLGELRDAGLLTSQEFAEKKAALLQRL